MIVKHVLLGAFFTPAGIVTLLTPEIPFICIGGLIFGPIELMIGLFGNERRYRAPGPLSAGLSSLPLETSTKLCGSCGMKSDAAAAFCTNCGAQFA